MSEEKPASPSSVSAQVGARVRRYRQMRKIRQGDLAKSMGIGQSRLSEIETGDTWTVDQMNAAAAALGVNVADLVPSTREIHLGPMLSPEHARLLDLVDKGRWLEAIAAIMEIKDRQV